MGGNLDARMPLLQPFLSLKLGSVLFRGTSRVTPWRRTELACPGSGLGPTQVATESNGKNQIGLMAGLVLNVLHTTGLLPIKKQTTIIESARL